MLGSFAQVRSYIKFKPLKASIDNFVFKLHYRATFLILLIATILVSSRQYIGEHIRCIVDNGVPVKVIDTFCFFTSTFTVVHHYNESMLDKGYIPHPGVGPSIAEDEVKHHAYYQWVPFMLFGQAIMFYLPRYLWRKKEGGRVQALVDGLQLASMSLEDHDVDANGKPFPGEKLREKIDVIKVDFINRLHASRMWSVWLIFCEILNFVNVIIQVHITNVFLGGHFLTLGSKVGQHDNWDRKMDPLDYIFPKVTKCEFHKYGPSGSIQKHDALCVMALNVINEKIYTFLWFWYLILFIMSALALIWRLMTFIFHSRSARFTEIVFASANPGRLNIKNVSSVTGVCQFADWLFLYYLAKNMDGFVFKHLYQNLAEELDERDRRQFPIYSDGDNSIDEKSKLRSPSPLSSIYDEGTLKLLSDDETAYKKDISSQKKEF